MNKKLLFIFSVAFFAFAFIVPKEFKELKIGKKMPISETKLQNIDGSTNSISSYAKSKGLIVVFSCNTCPFVVGGGNFSGWQNQYNELYELAIENDLGFVLVNSNEAKRNGDDSFDEMKKHANAEKYKMPYLVDENSNLANAFGARTTPHVFMFDDKNELIYRGLIDNSYDEKRTELKPFLKLSIDAYVNGKEIENTATDAVGCSIKRLK